MRASARGVREQEVAGAASVLPARAWGGGHPGSTREPMLPMAVGRRVLLVPNGDFIRPSAIVAPRTFNGSPPPVAPPSLTARRSGLFRTGGCSCSQRPSSGVMA